MNKKNLTGTFILVLFLISIMAVPARAHDQASEGTVRIGNILGSAVSTLVKGIIQGKVKNFGDAGKMFLYGGVAGYGFYTAKTMASKGNITSGVMLANLSASISENVSWGENPLAYIGYSLGPVRVKVATPLAKNPAGIVNVNVSAKEIINLAYSLSKADKVSFKYGLLTFEASEKLDGIALGWTKGIFPTTLFGTYDYVLNHEMVHVIQSIQLSSVSLYEPLIQKNHNDSSGKSGFFHFEGIKLDLFSLANDLANASIQYDSRWQEIEAHHFATDRQ